MDGEEMGVFMAFRFRVFPLKGAYYHIKRCQKDVMVWGWFLGLCESVDERCKVSVGLDAFLKDALEACFCHLVCLNLFVEKFLGINLNVIDEDRNQKRQDGVDECQDSDDDGRDGAERFRIHVVFPLCGLRLRLFRAKCYCLP